MRYIFFERVPPLFFVPSLEADSSASGLLTRMEH